MKKIILAAALAAALAPAMAERNLHVEWRLPTDGSFWQQERDFGLPGSPLLLHTNGMPIALWADIRIPDGVNTGVFGILSLDMYQYLYFGIPDYPWHHSTKCDTCFVELVNGDMSRFFIVIGSEHIFAQFELDGSLTEWNNWLAVVPYKVTPPPVMSPVPEPGSLALMGAGLLGLGAWMRRKEKANG